MLVDLVGDFEASGTVGHDTLMLLTRHNCPRTAEHCRRVAAESRRIAELVGADAALAEAAGWLHDISAVFPSAERAEIARRLGLELLLEEAAHPMIVHQKLSAVLA
jgi:HD superfamily phosphohydrolase YqeK